MRIGSDIFQLRLIQNPARLGKDIFRLGFCGSGFGLQVYLVGTNCSDTSTLDLKCLRSEVSWVLSVCTPLDTSDEVSEQFVPTKPVPKRLGSELSWVVVVIDPSKTRIMTSIKSIVKLLGPKCLVLHHISSYQVLRLYLLVIVQVMLLPVWNSARIGSIRNQEEQFTE